MHGLLICIVCIAALTQVESLKRITFKLQPLIGGPKWLPIHLSSTVSCLDGGGQVTLDLIPRDPRNSLGELLSLKAVSGIVRSRDESGASSEQQWTQDLLTRTKRRERLQPQEQEQNGDHDLSLYEEPLHLLRNNCYSFAWRVTMAVQEANREEKAATRR